MKAKSYKPEGFHTVTPYFMVDGASDFIEFLKTAFGADEIGRHTVEGRIMHAELRVGDSIIELADSTLQWVARSSATHLYVEDCDAVYARAMAAGAKSVKEVADQFYGDRSGGVEDQWGNHWYISTHKEDLTKEEVEERAAALKH
jgi:uncharacterized glyoxalase superfamily protein PhnB